MEDNSQDTLKDIQLVFIPEQNSQDSDDDIKSKDIYYYNHPNILNNNKRQIFQQKKICHDKITFVDDNSDEVDDVLISEEDENIDNNGQNLENQIEPEQVISDIYKGKEIQIEIETSIKEEEESNIGKNNELTDLVPPKPEQEKKEPEPEQKDYDRFEQISMLDKAFEKSLEELKQFKSKEEVDLVTKILNNSDDDTLNNDYIRGKIYNHVLRDILNLDNLPTEETEFANKLKEVEEPIHYIYRGRIFKIFNEPRENYMIKYEDKPIFKTIILGQKRKRKSMDDLMRKKYKVHVCNETLSILNSKLKKLKIKKKFKLPQSMKSDVTKKENLESLKMSLKDVLVKAYLNKNKIEKDVCAAIRENNQKIFEKLAKKGGNAEIDSILDIKMEKIYNEFYESEQFQNLIKDSEKNRNSYEYNYYFKNTSKNFVNFYTKKKSKKSN